MRPRIGSWGLSKAIPSNDAPWWRSGPLITPDANAVAHIIWRNGALVDTKGNSWTQSGTVPQVADSGFIPPGAGPFSTSNYYTLGSGADAVDLGGGTWTIGVVARLTSLPASSAPVLSNATLSTEGYLIQMTSAGLAQQVAYNGTGNSAVSANAVTAGQFIVGCFGRDAGTSYVKLNGGVKASAAAGFTAGSTSVATIGLIASLSRAFNGTIYEIYVTSSAPSDALLDSMQSQVYVRTKQAP